MAPRCKACCWWRRRSGRIERCCDHIWQTTPQRHNNHEARRLQYVLVNSSTKHRRGNHLNILGNVLICGIQCYRTLTHISCLCPPRFTSNYYIHLLFPTFYARKLRTTNKYFSSLPLFLQLCTSAAIAVNLHMVVAAVALATVPVVVLVAVAVGHDVASV